jgi:nucleotide-binding universal stress UspA family protein
MYERILLAYDGSEVGQQALLACKDLAQWSHADLWLVAVMPPASNVVALEVGGFTPLQTDQDRAYFQLILDDGLRQMNDAGLKTQGELLVGDSVYSVTEFAVKIDANLIVVGHKHIDGWTARWWRGATSGALIEHAHCSVLCVICD